MATDTSHSPTRTAAGDLQCVVVTPERTTLDERVDFVALPLYDGEVGILPGRAPFIGRLGFGELRTRRGDTTHRYFVDGGFAQVRGNVVTVLTSRAVPAHAISTVEVTKELDTIRTRRTANERELDEKARAVDRARAQLRVAAHRA